MKNSDAISAHAVEASERLGGAERVPFDDSLATNEF